MNSPSPSTEPEGFVVGDMVDNLADTVQSLMAKKRNQPILQLAPALGTEHSDLTKVRQILFNLLSNAGASPAEAPATQDGYRHASR